MISDWGAKVEEDNMDQALSDLPQLQLPLTRPQDTGQTTTVFP